MQKCKLASFLEAEIEIDGLLTFFQRYFLIHLVYIRFFPLNEYVYPMYKSDFKGTPVFLASVENNFKDLANLASLTLSYTSD